MEIEMFCDFKKLPMPQVLMARQIMSAIWVAFIKIRSLIYTGNRSVQMDTLFMKFIP